jgi:hypothetical protein
MKTNTTPSASSVQTTARTWIAKHPALKSRVERAIALVANVFTTAEEPDTYYIESSGETHKVIVNRCKHTSKCDCMDYMIRVRSGKVYRCKHQLAAALYETA